MNKKIKYTCKNCGTSTAIRIEWQDLKPRRCINRKCNTSFERNKEALLIEMPEVEKTDTVTEKTSRKRK